MLKKGLKQTLLLLYKLIFFFLLSTAIATDFTCIGGIIEDDVSYHCNVDILIHELDGKSVWDTTKIFKGINIKADLRLDKTYVTDTLLPQVFSQGVIPFQIQSISASFLHNGPPIVINFQLAPSIKAEMIDEQIIAKEASLNITSITTDQRFLQQVINNSGLLIKLNNDPKIKTEIIDGANELLFEVNKAISLFHSN